MSKRRVRDKNCIKLYFGGYLNTKEEFDLEKKMVFVNFFIIFDYFYLFIIDFNVFIFIVFDFFFLFVGKIWW